jgi:hypothetical protein
MNLSVTFYYPPHEKAVDVDSKFGRELNCQYNDEEVITTTITVTVTTTATNTSCN